MMAEPVFSPEMEKALDTYAVPPVPAGFSDRLMARIAGGDTKADAATIPLPAARPRRANPWRRTSKILGSVAIFSLATATAAAAGFFGQPVYVPGVSEALVEAKIVEAPARRAKPKVKMVAAQKAAAVAAVTSPPQQATGSAAIVGRVTELRNNPEYAKLTPRQRIAIAVKEVRQMVRSGEASRQDVRAAARELAQNADPATKEAWRKAAIERREKRLERRAQLAAQSEPQAASEPQTAGNEPAIAAGDTLPAIETAKLTPEKAEALRERYRTASPKQRAAMRSALRERRQARQQRRGQ
jgi:hypothetical protein